MKLKKRVFDIIQIGNKEDVPSLAFDIVIVVMIASNIICMFLETFQELEGFLWLFQMVEKVTVAFFCVEYVLRIWTAEYLYPKEKRWKAALRFLISYDGIVDLFTILPFFYLSGFIALRMFRVVRIFHLFRINAKYDSFNLIINVLYEKRKHIVSSMFIILVLMLASSLGMYSVEHEAQPEVYRNAFSGIWWSVSTLLTVGYGDIYPVTVIGRILAIVTAFLGVGVVAIPTGIISAGFVEQYTLQSNVGTKLLDIKEIGEIEITAQHPFCGKKVSQIQQDYGASLLLVMRQELSVLPTDGLVLREGDVVVLRSALVVKETQVRKKADRQ